MVEVTQEDREAADEATNPPDGWNPSEWAAEIIAHHRIAARKQALEEAAGIADGLAGIAANVPAHIEPVLSNTETWERVRDGAEDIATAIRALSDSHVDQD